jgi:hypothetical protein
MAFNTKYCQKRLIFLFSLFTVFIFCISFNIVSANENLTNRNYRFEYLRKIIISTSTSESFLIFKIPHDILSQTKDLKDFRIIKNKDREVPYSIFINNDTIDQVSIQTEIIKANSNTIILADTGSNLLPHFALQIPFIQTKEKDIHMTIYTSPDKNLWEQNFSEVIDIEYIENNFVQYFKNRNRYIRITIQADITNQIHNRPIVVKVSPLYVNFMATSTQDSYQVLYKSNVATQNKIDLIESLPNIYHEVRLGIQEINPEFLDIKVGEIDNKNFYTYYKETIILLIISLFIIWIIFKIVHK